MSGTRVLVVDDEIIIARELEARLRSSGYEVVEIASSGQEALLIAERTRPDLVLMDIVLKGDMDGVEAAEEIRKRWGIPIIYLTAYTDETTLQRARVTEPFGYIVKPFSERELRANIEMALYKHQAESKLRAVEKWFTTSMQQVGDGVIATNAQGTIIFMNRVAEVLAGCKSDEALGKGLNEVVSLDFSDQTSPPDPLSPIATEIGPMVEVGGDVFLVNQRRNENIPVYLAVTPLRNAEGDANGAVLVIRDLSDQRRAAQLLRETEERYLQTQKLEAVGLLAGSIAHEFNNLLTVITGYTSLLLNKPQVDQNFITGLRAIQHAGERGRNLTRRLLGFSRKQVFEARVVDLNALVSNTVHMLGQLIGEDITLTTRLAPTLGRVRTDPAQLEQALMNLVVNARDAMPQGGSLTIETTNVGLEESLQLEDLGVSPGHYVKLAVQDTGSGMSQEVKERIFEPFFTTKEPGRGTGLGLATVYGTVRRSQGHITVDSEPGRGSLFSIYLPEVEEENHRPEGGAEPEDMSPAPETVLLVEDDDQVRECIVNILQALGYKVLEANGPDEALGICEGYEDRIHLLLTDVVMPGMGGSGLAKRAMELRQGIKVLYISGYPDEIAIRSGAERGSISFLQKPFTNDALARKVREVLE